jgi:hypothetical protein
MIVIPNLNTEGIKRNTTTPVFTWRDKEGLMYPDLSGLNAATLTVFKGNLRLFAYEANDKMDFSIHWPHDWAVGTDTYIHVHWHHNGSAIADTMTFTIEAAFSKRDAVSGSNISTTITRNTWTGANQYYHGVDEVQLSAATGTSALFATGDLDIDGMVLGQLTLTTAPTVTAGSLFVSTIDIHYLSTNLGTVNKASPFY